MAAFVTLGFSDSGPVGHGSPKGDRPWLKERHRRVLGDRGSNEVMAQINPRGLLSNCTLLRLAHGQNGERFNLNLF
ncbi:Hypothetical predicted protein [Xyrichtys novacula]|uniref:Uncharacterized protein n=1 Tax=Xyrichtys novacula TaxID=13765 RepID=A0AAV1HGF1_XYRNO|nr:Hypothetical predicted protein [Xyrichtys novacula]